MDSQDRNCIVEFPMLDDSRFRNNGADCKIYDVVRGKWVAFTPEEFVRQRFCEWLINDKGYSKFLMANEIGLVVNKRSRRCDTVIFNHKREPYIIIEYKAPHVKISQSTFDQIVRYNSVLKAKYLVVTNGVSMYCCEMDYIGNTYRYLPEIPDFQKTE